MAQRERIAGELQRESLSRGYPQTYRILTRSMNIMLSAGDEVTVHRAQPEDIALGDIVAWQSSLQTGRYPVVHRVIRKRKIREHFEYLTRGDFCLGPDPFWVRHDEVIGKVRAVKKKQLNVRINLDGGAGKTISCLACAAVFIPAVFFRCVQVFARPRRTVPAVGNNNNESSR